MMMWREFVVLSAVAALLAGCSSLAPRQAGTPSTGASPGKSAGAAANAAKPQGAGVVPPYQSKAYYKDDGPGANPPSDLDGIPDAVPRDEPLHRFANRPYEVLGANYVPDTSGQPYRVEGLASWYGRKFHGLRTSSGEVYDMYGMTAAHRTLPIPSYVRVTNPANGRSVVLRINDRGPFHPDREIDLTYTAAHKLGVLKGVSKVKVERIYPRDSDGGVAVAMTTGLGDERGQVQIQPIAMASGSEMPVPAARNPAPASVKSPGGTYWLQLAAFSNPGSAETLFTRLKEHPDLPGIEKLEAGGMTKVQAGPYASAAQADMAALRLAETLGYKPYRVQR